MVNSLVKLFTTVALDFEVLWYAARDLLTINNPYLNTVIFTGVGYPPNSLLFYLPLVNLDYLIAQNIFTIVSIVSLFLCVYISLKILEINNKLLIFIISSFVLLSFPAKFTLGMGQNNIIALLFLLLSFYFFKDKKMYFAGILLGLSISLKTIFVYFVLYFILEKQWKVILYTTVTIVASIMIVYLIRGNLDLYKFYYTDIIPPLLNFENREIYYNQGLSGFVSRIIDDLQTRKTLTLIGSGLLVLVNAYFIYFKKNVNLLLSFTVITLLLIDSLAWQHHFVWLLFPFIVLMKNSCNFKDKVLIFLTYVLISLNIPDSTLLNSNVFIGTLILWRINIKYLK